MAESFGAKLRYERERRQIALTSIAERTKIGLPLLDGLERDDVSRWPAGIFRKSFIKSYAEAIGLDADAIVREFVERYPDPLESVSTASLHPTGKPASSPLSIKLTIIWSGSVRGSIGRLVDWQIRRVRNLPISQSANLPMVPRVTTHEFADEARGQAPPV